jgi:hypothetical protein
MKTIGYFAAVALILAELSAVPVYAGPAWSFTGGPSVPSIGKVVSATVQTTSDNDVVFTTPSKGSFLLTQVCASRAAGQTAPINLNCDSFGTIAVLPPSPSCVSFSPGYALPPGQSIRCDFFCAGSGCLSTAEDSVVCSISGVVGF